MMKKVLLLLLTLVFVVSAVGCSGTPTTKINYNLDGYEDLVEVEWSYFVGGVTINTDEKYCIDESSSVKVKIDHASILESYHVTKNEPLVPMFEFGTEKLGNIDLNNIAQFSVDIYNAGKEDFNIMLYAYNTSALNKLFYGESKVVHAGRWNSINFNVNRFFYADFAQSIDKFALGVYNANLNTNGVELYMDNVCITATEEVPEIDKEFSANEVLSFSNIGDMKYVKYFQNEPALYVAPTLYGYMEYTNGVSGGALRLNSLGFDGFLSIPSDTYGPKEQGFGFEILPDLIKKTSSGGAKLLILTAENVGNNPRLVTVSVKDKNGKELSVETRLEPNVTTDIAINIRKIGSVITELKVSCDSWNAGEKFYIDFSDIRYGEEV